MLLEEVSRTIRKLLREKIISKVFNIGNVISISAIVIAALYPFHKQILLHKIINNKEEAYFLKNDEHSYYCDFRSIELSWRFSKEIECKYPEQKKDKIVKLKLKDYGIIKIEMWNR